MDQEMMIEDKPVFGLSSMLKKKAGTVIVARKDHGEYSVPSMDPIDFISETAGKIKKVAPVCDQIVTLLKTAKCICCDGTGHE
jgi:hypothetical protein